MVIQTFVLYYITEVQITRQREWNSFIKELHVTEASGHIHP